MRWPARVNSGPFFVTTSRPTTGEDDTSESNPENIKRDAVDVAPSVPAPEDKAAAEPAPENEAAAEPTTAEPARRGPVMQELEPDAWQPDGYSSLSPGHIANRTQFMPPKRTVWYQP